MQLNRKTLFFLSSITLFGFSILGLLIIVFLQEKDLFSLFQGHMSMYWQIGVGCTYGIANGLIGMSIVQQNYFQEVSDYFKELFSKGNIQLIDILYLSIAAGVGEEILFRGAIQPYLGIWITAVLFIVVHGYLDPRRNSWFLVGLYMIVMSAGLGYLFEYCGIISAMIAHAVYDLIIVLFYKRSV